MSALNETWPAPGRCGACGRPATAFPSGNWEHDGRPCRLRNGALTRPFDLPLPPCVFVADGNPLPTCPQNSWPTVVAQRADDGFPTALGYVPPERVDTYWERVREQLAAEAEEVS